MYRLFVASLAITLPQGVFCMLDIRHFAGGQVALPDFVEPGIQPPSFILSLDQNKPPYDISAEAMEPFPGCSASYASLCAVQHSIRLVTRVREEVCADIALGGAAREAALQNITDNAYRIESTVGFGVFALGADGVILADALRGDLVGQHFDGFENSGYIAQASLLDYIAWVIKYNGGFVPHFTTRLSGTAINVSNGDAPERASAYFESCESGERIGVAFSRTPLPALDGCDGQSNHFCAMQNVRRVVGRVIVDILNTHSFDAMNEIQYKISYGEDYSVGSFYVYNMHLSWYGYPGENQWKNEAVLPDSEGTYWAIGSDYAKTTAGTNLSSWLEGEVDGVGLGTYVQVQVNEAAWKGGAWQDYLFWSSSFDWHHKVALSVGYLWNGTAFLVGSGLLHRPAEASVAPACAVCPNDITYPCAFENAVKLSSHVETDFATPASNWSRISSNKWFGSAWADADGDEYEGTWPEGFYITTFDFDGNCVADTESPLNIGVDAATWFGDAAFHEKCKTIANVGGGWIRWTDPRNTSQMRLARVTLLAKSGVLYYMLASFTQGEFAWRETCSSAYVEPCTEENTEALVGRAMADILLSEGATALQEAIGNITGRVGFYSPDLRSDYRAWVLTDEGLCHNYSAECPDLANQWWPTILESDGWVELETTSSYEARMAFVKKTSWSSPIEVASEDVFIVVLAGVELGHQPCFVAGGCPAHSYCSDEKRCACMTGYRANFTVDEDWCGPMPPASLECVNVQNQMCDGVDCAYCPEGYYCPFGEALPCAAGFYCTGGGSMSLCPRGTYGTTALATNISACSTCEAGRFGGTEGATACSECIPGTAINSSGQSSCDYCAVGWYQESPGSTTCVPCPSGFTTMYMGANSPADCVCPFGTYLALESGLCETCGEGLSCSQDNTSEVAFPSQDSEEIESLPWPYPRVTKGYMTIPGAPLTVYKCKEGAWCPGGSPGSCAENRDQFVVGCSKCLPHTRTTTDGSCSPCESYMVVVCLTLGCLSLLGGLALLALLVNRNQLNQSSAATVVIISLGLGVTAVQTLALFGNLAVKWVEPIRSMFKVLSLMSFDMTALQIECLVGNDSVMNMAVRQLIAPCSVVYICIVVLAKKILREPGLELSVDIVNAVGAIFQLFFVSIFVSSLTPFICFAHPNDLGYSMVSEPGVLCTYQGEHLSMATVSGLALCFVILPYLTGVTYATVQYRRVMSDSSQSFLHLRRYRFLFFRYSPERYWYGCAVLLRSTLICIVPVIFRDLPSVQVLVVAATLLLFAALQLYTQAWRGFLANVTDATIALSLVLLVLCVAMTTNFDDAELLVGICAAAIFVVIFAGILGVVTFGVFKHFVPMPYYQWFICHHKAGAAAQARYLQLLLVQRTHQRCFLDSDNLTNLEELFDTVRCHCGRLCVYLTADTLRRPWCAGEITIAWQVHKRITAIRHPSFTAPEENDIAAENMHNFLAAADFKLVEYNITSHLMSQAYRWLLTELRSVVVVPSEKIGRTRFDAIVDGLLDNNRAPSTMSSTNHSLKSFPSSKSGLSNEIRRSGMFVLSSLPFDDEATAAAGIIVGQIQQAVIELVPPGMLVLADSVDPMSPEVLFNISNAHIVTILLSAGSLQNLMQLQVILNVITDEIPFVAVSTPNFRFPSAQFFEEELPLRFESQAPAVEAALQTFFKSIILPLTTYGSFQVLSVQTDAIVKRIPRHHHKSLSANGTINLRWAAQQAVRPSSSAQSTIHAQSTIQSLETTNGPLFTSMFSDMVEKCGIASEV